MKKTKLLISVVLALVMTLIICAPAFATVDDTGYSDVDADAWYAAAAKELLEKELMIGTDTNIFSPNSPFTRAQLAMVLYRMAGSPDVAGEDTFPDTNPDAWYAKAVLWAQRENVVNGVENGLYAPDRATTQEMLVTMLWRDAGEPDAASASDASAWAAEAVGWARETGLIRDDANYTFAPESDATRAQIAVTVSRYLAAEGNGSANTNAENRVAVFDLDKKTVLLNSGYEMPILGLGTNRLSLEQAEVSVSHALTHGYRMIDTANGYLNERGVGRGIADANLPRESFFITAKLWPSQYERGQDGIDETLERLGLEYVDLMILHHPFGDYVEGYKAVEEAVAQGKVRSIGLSNFSKEQIEEIMSIATITPSVLQVEAHPYYQQKEMMEYIKQYNMVLEAWYTLGGRGNTQTLFDDETISAIASAHNKTSAQVILRWHLQAGHIAIPGSSNPDHIDENYNIFDFELSDTEMKRISGLDTGRRFFLPDATDEMVENMIMGMELDFNAQ